jgi:hypothetical protein
MVLLTANEFSVVMLVEQRIHWDSSIASSINLKNKKEGNG